MARRKFVPGYRQGSWTILEAPFNSKKALLRCDCGHEGWYFISNLSSHKSTKCQSCRVDSPETYTFKSVKYTANRRRIKWTLSFEEWLSLSKANCYYCDSPPSNKLAKGVWCNGIDRVDSTGTYEIKNCVTSCRVCNRAKSDMRNDDFLEWVRRIYAKQCSV